jgi:hypothetical protein
MKRMSARIFARAIGASGVKQGSGTISSRYSMMTDGDDLAVVVEGRNDAVGIEREVAGLELVAREQVELLLIERKLLGVEHEAHALAAS